MSIDPKTAATLAKFVIQIANDDEARNKALLIILAPLITVLLILAFIIYIVTSPLESIAGFFIGNELDLVKGIRTEYGYEQLINPNDQSYIESSGLDFSGVSFKNGRTEVIYYNQLDSRWKDTPYGKTGNIGKSGCGPTALSMVASSLTDKK